MSKTIEKISFALLALMACGGALAQEPFRGLGQLAVLPSPMSGVSRLIFGNNLVRDPCTTCNYSEEGGYFVWGLENCTSPGRAEWLAVPFIASATGVPERISAAIILAEPAACPTNKVRLSIYSDAGYPTGPGKRLVSGTATVAVAPCDLAMAKLKDAPVLTEGTKYWVTATTTDQQAGLNANWYGSNDAQYANNLGSGWQQFPSGTPAFKVEGSSVVLSVPQMESPSAAFGGNLFVDPDNGCNYDSNSSGFDVWGPENCTSPGTRKELAVPFVAAKSGVPTRISASLILRNPAFCLDNQVTLSLYTDDCGRGPGLPLVSGVATVPVAPCDLAVAELRDAPALTRMTKYWVVATTNARQAALTAGWYDSNNGQIGFNNGFGWLQFSAGTPGFMVE